MQLKTRGIVLKQRNIGENDRIITVLTADLGLIEISARRVKSAKSGISAACQLLSYSEFCLYKGKGSYIVNSAESIESFYSLRLDIVKVALCGYFSELVAHIEPTIENSEDILRLLLNSIYLLIENKIEISLLKSIFELRIMAVSGFMPNLVCCGECSRFEAETMYFLPLDGSLICGDCFNETSFGGEVIKFSAYPPVLAAMRHIIFAPFEKLFSFKLAGDSAQQLAFIAENYVLLQTEGRFKSLEIYKAL